MRPSTWFIAGSLGVALCSPWAATAADYPAPKSHEAILKDFRFSSGEVLPQVKITYTTIGEPSGEPVLILHGTAGAGTNFLTADFAGELFGAGQPLDAQKYFIILPDAIGTGKSTKPSDGLRMKFPHYTYDDMVAAQHRLVNEGLGLKHLRLVMGNSMGGMQTWIWGTTYPDMMDALVPMASLPTQMSARNWIMRRMLIESIRNDPAWKGGDYTEQPPSAKFASAWFSFATSGGTQAYYRTAPTRELADKLVNDRLKAPFAADANDVLYQWESSRDYNLEPKLDRIQAPVLVINAADDERNPPELGIMERVLPKLPQAKLHLIAASADTRGHGTTGLAKFWKQQFQEFMADVPKRPS